MAKFIKKNYPNKKFILDVAGGKGLLKKELKKLGYSARTIDPKGNDIRKKFSIDLLFNLKKDNNIDLVVGLHPNGATREICKAAKICDIVLVPCCNKWSTKNPDIHELVENYFKSNHIEYYTTVLEIKGKNIVYFTKNYVSCNIS